MFYHFYKFYSFNRNIFYTSLCNFNIINLHNSNIYPKQDESADLHSISAQSRFMLFVQDTQTFKKPKIFVKYSSKIVIYT